MLSRASEVERLEFKFSLGGGEQGAGGTKETRVECKVNAPKSALGQKN